MADSAAIRVQGLSEFQRGLKKLDSDAPKALRIGLNTAATILVTHVQPKVPRRTGRARASFKARSTRTSARVGMGGNKAPYTPWLDFGGRTGRGGSVQRPFFREGRYLFPTLREVSPEIEEALLNAIKDVARQAGIEVT